MKVFSYLPGSFSEIRKALLIRMSVLAVVITIVVSFLPVIQGSERTFLETLVITIPIMFITFGGSLWYSLKKQKKQWESTVFTIADGRISRTADGLEPLSFTKEDIKEIIESEKGHLVIKSTDKFNFIAIPPQVSDREELREIITHFGEIIPAPKRPFQQIELLGILGALGLMLGFFSTEDATISLLTGIPLLAVMVWGTISVRKSKVFDKRLKKMWWISLIPTVAILWKLLLSIQGKL
ncbi:MAG: hypothetical protein AAF655_06495 [Bacteroidota bacterium]